MYQFLYKRDKPMPIKIIGVLAAVFSIVALTTYPLFGLVLALGAGGLIAYQSGIELNFKDRTYRMITAIGNKSFGNWEPLPPIKCVSVFKTTFVSSTYGRSNASITTKQSVIQVNLATEQNQRIRLFETENLQDALKLAKDVALKLNLSVWDATEAEGKWL
ncbi:MAG: hypothetical protein K9G41_07735 [Flavobacteriales bacterium]|nr:hypothetical protein [Flavobacteriales bacterium]